MPGKHVHFATDAFPDTPSPTFSSTSLPSSGGPLTPVSAAGSSIAGPVLARIHPLLGITQPSPMLKYDLSKPPSTIMPNVLSIPPHALNEQATTPPIPSMVIRCPHHHGRLPSYQQTPNMLPYAMFLRASTAVFVTRFLKPNFSASLLLRPIV